MSDDDYLSDDEIISAELTNEERETLLAAAEIMDKLEQVRPWQPMFYSYGQDYVSAEKIGKRFRVLSRKRPEVS